MTREEAAKMIKDDIRLHHNDLSGKYRHALNIVIEALQQPEIIHCRKCKFASGDSRICMKFGHSPIGELDFCAWAERREE